jgi:hypothetical protein
MRVPSFVLLAACLTALGCGAAKEDDGGPGSLTAPDAGGGGLQTGDDASLQIDAAGGGDPGGGDAACAAKNETAKLVPLDIFIMMDQSGSMSGKTTSGATKWDAVKAAISAFLGDPGSAGLGVGLGYFPIETGGFFSDDSCNLNDYKKPEVTIAPLPGVKSAIEASLAKHGPSGGTPTGPALRGALTHANEWRIANPGRTVAVLLATDGMPTSCTPTKIPEIAADAAAAAKAGVRSYVIGVLADEDITAGGDKNLDAISTAGNGGPAFVIKSGSADVTKSFLDALKVIRGSALACEYTIPTGVGADFKKVNVNVTIGGTPSVVPYVGSAAGCDAAKGGWYYDVDPSAGKPTKILLCGGTCKPLQADGSAKIDIAVGCATVVK